MNRVINRVINSYKLTALLSTVPANADHKGLPTLCQLPFPPLVSGRLLFLPLLPLLPPPDTRGTHLGVLGLSTCSRRTTLYIAYGIGTWGSSPVARGCDATPNLPKGPLLATKWVKNGVFVGGLREWGSKSPLLGVMHPWGSCTPKIDPGYGPVGIQHLQQFPSDLTLWPGTYACSGLWL